MIYILSWTTKKHQKTLSRPHIQSRRKFKDFWRPKITGMRGGGGGEGGQCQKFVTSLVCLLHSAESEHKNLLRDRAYDFFVFPYISKIKQIINYLFCHRVSGSSVACEQAVHLGYSVKSRRPRGT